MAKMKKSIFRTTNEDKTYEFVSWSDLKERDDPAVRKIISWNAFGTENFDHKVWFNFELVDKIDQEFNQKIGLNESTSGKIKWAVFCSFRPPVSYLTEDDYVEYVKSFGHNQATVISGNYHHPIPMADEKNNTYYRAWPEVALAKNVQNIPENEQRLSSQAKMNCFRPAYIIFEKATRSSNRKSPNIAEDLISLNYYLYGEEEGKFEGSFGDFLKSNEHKSEELRKDVENLTFRSLKGETLLQILRYGSLPSVASLQSASKKHREELLKQDREMWQNIVIGSPEYKKSKTKNHLPEFLDEIKEKLGRPTPNNTVKTLSYDEIRDAYVMLAATATSKITGVSSGKIFGLNKIVFDLIGDLKNIFAKEHSKLLDTVNKVSRKTDTELNLKQVVALLATQHSNAWCHAYGDRGLYLIQELIEKTQNLEILNLIYDLAFGKSRLVPTEAEWIAVAEDVVNFSIPAEMFLVLACDPKADRKSFQAKIPKSIVENKSWY